MRSIRLTLTVYFLVLLAVALAAASVFVYQTAQQTLLSEQKARRQLIETQYAERGKAEEARLDADLLAEAQTLARLAQFQFDWGRHHEAGWLGVLSAAAGPNAYATTPLWIAQGPHGPLSFALHRRSVGEITFDGTDVLEEVSDKYFQIDSAWGPSYRSQSMGDRSFPRGANVFVPDQGPAAEFSDYDFGPGAPVRRVVFKSFARIASPPKHGHDAHRSGPPGPPPELQPRSPICIQCAASTRGRDAALAALQEGRDGDLARLDADTTALLAGLRNRLLLIGTAAFLAAVLGCYGLVRLGLSPLRRLSDAVSRVSEKDFRLPLDQRRLPGELRPIAQRMVDTLEMLKRAFAREKQATADISHELRTPLAALLTTTEIALRKPRTAEEYQELLRDCRLSASR